MNQPTLFDPPPSGIELRDQAIAQVHHNADPAWKAAALDAVEMLHRLRLEFTSDDVWLFMEERHMPLPHERRALGAIMVAAARRGWIEPSDRHVASERPEAHARPIRIWRSL